MFHYCIAGSGLFGSVFAYEASKRGKKCLVLEKRPHIGGNCYTHNEEGINVHSYGAHIFRTSELAIWNYMQCFCEFNHFINSPLANYKGEIYNLPFNMNTFSKLWNIRTPQQAKAIIEEQKKACPHPSNLEEHALSLVGTDVYEKFIKGYTQKQWGRSCKDLPSSILRRIPVRFIYDNNYFNDPYQGIPKRGYTRIFEKLLEKCEVRLNTDFLEYKQKYKDCCEKVIFTGTIDSYFDFCLGTLEYRSLRFEQEYLECENYQGVAVVNYTDEQTPFTRIIEHKHFEFGTQKHTIISREYPQEYSIDKEAYYPINDERNTALYEEYRKLAHREEKVIFGGRLGSYRYYDMQDVIKAALELVSVEFRE
ncbi:UDP-galactopyranose mutase [Campylobacter sp. MIT 21-1685]|uniref:UDP-galactopyranose mutase n=1 Tax=unclassified Campylobacter TaxID=2593542 RepID=UPI00224A9CD8|nr:MULTISPECIES: UDP-galactopyranose mutase [unclassified Campylobacter]MCX2683305.1 UDP-galactopyranose mutase [Campylobacter sp. MIT 21-1684]MCX2751639.1 UDP-galactopyranose mutase [Campylobacter sp. MIT 21-1682]MCX2807839.1 UDP-galactopyranose mutase [Campylobacter sp. MIT 21-1685]